MKAITLHQPYASLIVDRQKHRFETRSWAPPLSIIGQWIAIHAARTFTRQVKEVIRARIYER